MMMPVRQDCPKCGEEFVGSDAIGDICPRCELKERGINIKPCPACGGRGFFLDTEQKTQISEQEG